MTISPALRGISLILAVLDEQIDFGERSIKTSAFKWAQEWSGFYLTGQVVAAYSQVRLTPQGFGGPRRRDFAKLNLHLALFDQPGKDGFFGCLLGFSDDTDLDLITLKIALKSPSF